MCRRYTRDRFEQIQVDLKSSTSQSEHLLQTFAQELTALETPVSEIAQPVQQVIQNVRQNWKEDTELNQMLAQIQARLTGLESTATTARMETDMVQPTSSGVHLGSCPPFNSFRASYAQDLQLTQAAFQKVQQHLKHHQTQMFNWTKK